MHEDDGTRRIQWFALSAGSALSLLVSIGLANIWFDVGSLKGNFIHQYSQFFSIRAIWIAALVAGASIVLVGFSESLIRRHERLTLLLWLVAALPLQALLRSLTFTTFERNIRSVNAFSFYTVTQRYRPGLILSGFLQLRPDLPLHAQSNMPGKLIFMYALELITSRTDVLPWLIVAISNAGGVLLYVFVLELLDDRRTALYSLVLYLLVPAKLYFFPQLNAVTPVIVLMLLVVTQRWLQTSCALYAALLGPIVYALAFFEPTGLSSGLLVVALIARARSRRIVSWRTVAVQCGVAVLMFAATYVLIQFCFRFDLFSTMRQLAIDAAGFNIRRSRPYDIWVRQNMLDFFFGVGIGQTALAAVAWWRSRPADPIVLLVATLTATLVAIDLLGVNRGEVIRLWMFLACLFQVPAAYVCARLENRVAVGVLIATTVLQDALGTHMIGFIGF
jgi:hypothetical protein